MISALLFIHKLKSDMNFKKRKFRNKKYLKFIRSLPCSITGLRYRIDAHHVYVKGMGAGNVNDYYTVPLSNDKHIKTDGHINKQMLEDEIKEDPRDLIIFYLSMYVEKLEGKYDVDADDYAKFIELKRKREGII